jgi:hypothetical protein
VVPPRTTWRRVAGIPRLHLLGLAALALLFFAPMVCLAVEFRQQLPISRVGSYWVDDAMAIQTTSLNFLTLADFLLRPKFWALTFSGAIFAGDGELRFMVGAAVPVLVGVVLLGGGAHRRRALLIALAGLAAMGTNQLPLSLVLKVFPFSLIHNAGFIYQFGFFALAVAAGLGVADLDGERARRWMGRLASAGLGVLALLLAAQSVLAPPEVAFNRLVLAAGMALMVALVFAARRLVPARLGVAVALLVAAYGLATTAIHLHRSVGGEVADAAVADRWRYRDDHSLAFLDRRPDEVQVLADVGRNWIGVVATTEFSSLLTRTDNSYRTLPGMPLSSFPLERDLVLLSALPGYEGLLGPKFHLFDRVFASTGLADLAELKRRPGLLAAMVGAGIGLVEGAASGTLGPFSPEAAQALVATGRPATAPAVTVIDYRATAIELDATIDRPGVLAYSDLWDKGWTVTVDGRPAPMLRVYHGLKGVALDAGRHRVVFSYGALSTRLIVVMQVVFAAMMLALAVTGRRTRIPV